MIVTVDHPRSFGRDPGKSDNLKLNPPAYYQGRGDHLVIIKAETHLGSTKASLHLEAGAWSQAKKSEELAQFMADTWQVSL